MPDHGLAEEIAEDLLYRTGRAMKDGDFEAFFQCFEIPQVMETAEGDNLITTTEEMRDIFDQVRRYYAENEVCDSARAVVRAEFLDDETIGSTHVTQLLQEGGKAFRKPYPVYSVLKRLEGRWKIVSNSTAILDAPQHNQALLSKVRSRIPVPKDL